MICDKNKVNLMEITLRSDENKLQSHPKMAKWFKFDI